MFDKKVETFLKLGSGAVEAPAGNSSCDSAEEVHDRSGFVVVIVLVTTHSSSVDENSD